MKETNNLIRHIRANKKMVVTGVSVFLFMLFSYLCFNSLVSIGGDDSYYIIAAKNFITGKSFPAWHGALYPILLSPFVALFGIKVTLFKLLSVIFTIAQIILIYKTWLKQLPIPVLLLSIVLCSVNIKIITYGGSTYSEPLFMLLQVILFYLFYKVDSITDKDLFTRISVVKLLLFGLVAFMLVTTRNIGMAVVVTIIIYYTINKRFKLLVSTLLSFLIFYIPFSIYSKFYWNLKGVGFSAQLSKVMYINPYKPSEGTENFSGMVTRFWDNCNQYLSKHLLKFLGFRDYDSINTSNLITTIIILFAIVLTVHFFRKRKDMFFVGIYLIVSLVTTFITQQVYWDQERLILIYLLLIIIFFGTGLYDISGLVKLKAVKIILVIVALLSVGLNLKNTITETIKCNKTKDAGRYATYSPDWQNYVRMSEWVGKNVPKRAVVACRKPNMAQIYGNREFIGLYKVTTFDPDTMLLNISRKKIEYVVCGRLRSVPTQYTGEYITTVHNTLKVILQKYLYAAEKIHTIGKRERTTLYQLHLNNTEIDLKTAIKRLETNLDIYPDNLNALYAIAELNFKTKNYSAIINYSNRGINLANKKMPFIRLRGLAYYFSGEYKKAITDYKVLTVNEADNWEHWYNLGVCYYKLGDENYKKCWQKSEAIKKQRG
jgi:tetratricopeptide (TPR) repeat protein